MKCFSNLAGLLALAACALQTSTAAPQVASGKVAPPVGCTLRVHVDGLRNANGKVGTVIFDTPDGWPENVAKSLRHGPADIDPTRRQATAVWEHLPPGDYGVLAMHDENGNAKLDKNFLGIPKEGFGFANNPRVLFSPPSFKTALVHLACPISETTIHIQYK